MPERMKPYLPSAVLLLLIVYLGVQALTGQRGLLSGHERDALLEQREAQLAGLMRAAPRSGGAGPVSAHRHLSRDLLEERARVVLGFADPRDYVIRVSARRRTPTSGRRRLLNYCYSVGRRALPFGNEGC